MSEVKNGTDAPGSIYSRLVRANISHGAFRLWHLLRDYMNHESGLAWPSQETIAEQMHCKVHSIKGWTDELVAAGFLTTETRGQRHYFVYRFPVVLPEWAERDIATPAPIGIARSLDLPKRAMPRPAPMGRQTEPKEPIIPISNSKHLGYAVVSRFEYMDDGYISEKTARNGKLRSELAEGKTRLCLELNELHLFDTEKARELVGLAMEKENPGAWLNKAITNALSEMCASPESNSARFVRPKGR